MIEQPGIDPICSLRSDLQKIGLKPNRLKGQNFLLSPKTRDRIADIANLSDDSAVLEIGPGTGILTWALLKYSSDILAVELEQKMFELLQQRFGNICGFQAVKGDALVLLRKSLIAKPRKVVSNLPYAISSPVLLTMAADPERFPGGVLLLQKEVVDRVTAKPGDGDRSVLSVLVQHSFEAVRMFNVKASKFYPRPKVDSAVIKLYPRDIKHEVSWEVFVKTLHLCFSSRRKTIFNNLRSRWNSEFVSQLLKIADVESGLRPQDLSGEAFIKIASLGMKSIKAE
ncbi:16S rRNA (adenine(1518)-N(6)/adenine(1519)-N(6))-dimethyltransferase RsmA [bacterium]|nr:16S rRNA (adenine(1518)-N(6)/adenine(1519)-N(6))-dimethyltransferase RsmA [bacterium]